VEVPVLARAEGGHSREDRGDEVAEEEEEQAAGRCPDREGGRRRPPPAGRAGPKEAIDPNARRRR